MLCVCVCAAALVLYSTEVPLLRPADVGKRSGQEDEDVVYSVWGFGGKYLISPVRSRQFCYDCRPALSLYRPPGLSFDQNGLDLSTPGYRQVGKRSAAGSQKRNPVESFAFIRDMAFVPSYVNVYKQIAAQCTCCKI